MKNSKEIRKKINELKKDRKKLEDMNGRTDDGVVPRDERKRLITSYKYNIGAECGYQTHSDINGAKNIGKRGLSKLRNTSIQVRGFIDQPNPQRIHKGRC